ncbi:MAG: hypothetical protein J1E63_04745 [Muribaculaceae bacterium]|nr:hypothetical protein [Muribaculaceae bacterium]
MTTRTLITILAWLASIASQAAVIIDGQLDASAIYPGTIHTYKISIPEGYSPADSACLYLGLDGILCNAPAVIDSLIAEGAMPVTIGVYLNPGVVYKADGETPLRYNRSNEFDATDDRFARFLETELLPAVRETLTPDGLPIHLKQGGDNAVIFGLSSGGIAAFNAAWHRPDLFGRIFSGCGTFVPMRGGEQLEAIVRKHEPKPLRVFLQDGFSDTWNPIFGSWYEHNRLLGSALEFAGYDCAFDWAEGGHSVARSSEIFADVMRWLWRDYPHSLTPGTTANNFLVPLFDGQPGEWTVRTGTFNPVDTHTGIFNADSTLFVEPAIDSNFMIQYTVDPATGTLANGQRFYYLHSYNNSLLNVASLAFDSAGYLWTLTDAGLQALDQNGRVRGILALPLNLPPLATSPAELSINDGNITIVTTNATYTRRLNIAPAIPGVAPQSQGPG